MHNVTLIEGDGIGPEICRSLLEVSKAMNLDINFEKVNAGKVAFEQFGELIPQNVYDSIEKNKVAIKGPVTTPIGEGFRSVNVYLRKKYDLYANIRPVISFPKIETPFKNVDITVFRENTEDLYAGIEEISEDGNTAKSIKIITREKSERIAKKAFEFAKANKKEKVTVVTKANIMKYSDGLFLDVAREVSKNYKEIELEEVLIDNMCMQLVSNPSKYQVILTENLYGDILSDLCAGLTGGLGLVPGANVGDDIALFESVHGSAPDIANKGIANPTALLLSFCMLLDYIDLRDDAEKLRSSIKKTLLDKNNFTKDLGGNLTTQMYTEKIIENLG
ncbi:MAG: isocitrate/isopropylmalate family dehydrogenase [Peptoniphilaceae bacterium]|nr:isocitrate/isopropylmalate family dehydrogenase [Peptoniphilaceae bacterium]MDD7383667.1 isocitrate/isopropylmalate family dehydrogenase [Peptoniphilaceae bacterium]MDY3737838.1 isocitrate/isopropylmalate family dehydrogenase [Peptoniphilaceae bacterium]